MSKIFIRPEHRPNVRAAMDTATTGIPDDKLFEDTALSGEAWTLSGCKEDKGDKNKEVGKDDKGERAATKDLIKQPKRAAPSREHIQSEFFD